MGLFGTKKEVILGNTCPNGMEFSEPERMMCHMVEDHKSKKLECHSCGFRN